MYVLNVILASKCMLRALRRKYLGVFFKRFQIFSQILLSDLSF